jgi:hypothetical protein
MGTVYTALSGTCIMHVLGFILEHEWGSSVFSAVFMYGACFSLVLFHV